MTYLKPITSVCLLFTFTFLFAQSSDFFNYQGVARDTDGSPIANENIQLRVTILEGDMSGPEVYVEEHTVMTNEHGLFNIKIGRGTVMVGNFSNVNWNYRPTFMKTEIDVDGNGFEVAGINEMASVPYAIHASNGSKWSTGSDDILYYTEGSVGINNSSPQANLDVSGEIRVSSIPHPNRDYVIRSGNLQEIFANNDLVTHGNRGIEFYVGERNPEVNFAVKDGSGNTMFVARPATGNVGVGVQWGDEVYSKFQVRGGDIYIEDVNSGVIMKSPNGNCWRMTVSNAGEPVFENINCP